MYEEMRRAVELAAWDQREMLLRDLQKEAAEANAIIQKALARNSMASKLLRWSQPFLYFTIGLALVTVGCVLMGFNFSPYPLLICGVSLTIFTTLPLFYSYSSHRLLNKANELTDNIKARLLEDV